MLDAAEREALVKEERKKGMSVEIEQPQKPLSPIPYSEWMDRDVYEELQKRYESLLSEYNRILDIKYHQVEGVSESFDADRETYSVDEYNMVLKKFSSAREKYNAKYDGMIETREMVKANINRLYDALEKYDATHKMEDLNFEEPADFQDDPNDDLDTFKKKMSEQMNALAASSKQFSEAFARNQQIAKGLVSIHKELDGEISKFADIRDKINAARQAAF